ncbi:MAG: hypothetical protein C0408_08200 [Odoribacter sp.]|nr:hypothetical protein [Odoribacter sp.]
MKKIFSFALSAVVFLMLFSCTSKKPASSSDQYIGDWYAIKGDVQIYSFYQDSTGAVYVGTLHDRPVVQGSWKIENNKFIITPEYEAGNSNPILYDFVLRSDTLYFNNGEEIYTKTIPLYIRHPELEIFEKLKWDIGLKFDQPVPSDLDWYDGLLTGYSVKIDGKLNSGDMGGIFDCLEANGFTPDSIMVSELCSGYKADLSGGRIFLTACSSQDPEATDDSFTITITVAMKK